MSQMKKVIISGIVVVVAIAGILLFSGKNDNDTIKVGVMQSLTGGLASYGEAGKNGFSMAVEEINSKGGIDGKQIEVIYEDSKCSPKDALSSAQKLISIDKVKYIAGSICSGEVLAVLPLTEENKILYLAQGSSPEITGKGKYFFRTWPSDALSGKYLADFLSEKYQNIAVITGKTDYTTALSKTLSAELVKNGKTVSVEEVFNEGANDFRDQLSKIKAKNPDVLFVNVQTGTDAAKVSKQARELGIKAQLVVAFLSGDEFVKSGPSANGTIIMDTAILDIDREVSASFAKKYNDRFGNTPLLFISGQMYDYAYLLKNAIEKGGESADDAREYLLGIEKYQGVIGDFSFDQYGDVKGIGFSFKKVVDNTVVEYK